MIDIRRLRSSFDEVKANLARRHIDVSSLDAIVELDQRVRDLSSERDALRAQIKSISKDVGQAHRSGDKELGQKLAQASRELGEKEKALDETVSQLDLELRDMMLVLPNEIAPEVPDGASEDDNVVIRAAEERTWHDYQRVPHWEIGDQFSMLDSERAVKLSGSMFNMFRGYGATLARALCQYALDRNADAWEEVRPPSIVKTETLVATGHLPKFEDELYGIERDGLWTIPTAEVPLTSMARDEIIDESQLPVQMMAYTPCFRREAGAAGKDTRGMLRVHEFDKVELMGYATPETAEAMMFDILERSYATFVSLGFQVRILEICAGDLSRSHRRSFDIEAYAPGTDAWLELSSVSWFGDYQARRANVRYRPAEGGGNQIVHTCNGSALAVPRAWATLVETHRQPDGSINIPEPLRPYMRGLEAITPK